MSDQEPSPVDIAIEVIKAAIDEQYDSDEEFVDINAIRPMFLQFINSAESIKEKIAIRDGILNHAKDKTETNKLDKIRSCIPTDFDLAKELCSKSA